MKKRKLKKSIDFVLKAVAVILGVAIASIDDFDISSIKIILGMIAVEIVVVLILNAYGRV